MDDNELEQEILLLDALEERNMRAFMQLYKSYGDDLLIFAYAHLRDPRLAAKTVDDLFERLWSDADFTAIKPPIYTYLIDQIKKICKQKHW